MLVGCLVFIYLDDTNIHVTSITWIFMTQVYVLIPGFPQDQSSILLNKVEIVELVFAPPKTNMSPENQWLEDVFPTKTVPF